VLFGQVDVFFGAGDDETALFGFDAPQKLGRVAPPNFPLGHGAAGCHYGSRRDHGTLLNLQCVPPGLLSSKLSPRGEKVLNRERGAPQATDFTTVEFDKEILISERENTRAKIPQT
jgi:hypothetical protein